MRSSSCVFKRFRSGVLSSAPGQHKPRVEVDIRVVRQYGRMYVNQLVDLCSATEVGVLGAITRHSRLFALFFSLRFLCCGPNVARPRCLRHALKGLTPGTTYRLEARTADIH